MKNMPFAFVLSAFFFCAFNVSAETKESSLSISPAVQQQIEALTGTKGKYDVNEGVFKISIPRTDVQVAVDSMILDPFMGLTSWAGFANDPKEGMMVMGDLVLFEDEVNPVMSAALDNGLEVTALHNHFFYDEPKVFYMHIAGRGGAKELVSALQTALDKIKAIRAKSPYPVHGFGGVPMLRKNSITPGPLENTFGIRGEAKGGMFKVVLGRKTKMPCGCEVGKNMGINTWAAFAGSDDNAFVDGDFAVFESELQSTLKLLRSSGINIVAIHNHMIEENPRIIFLHYWGKGSVAELSGGLKAALAALQR